MAVFQREQVGIREIGETVSVPDHYVARAMFYLKCICNVLDLSGGNENLDRLTDFRHHYLLTEGEIDELTILMLSIKPDELIGKCMFHDEEICGDSNNKFFELEAVRHNMVVTNDILIAGQQRRVNRIMFFKRSWLTLYCLLPLNLLSERFKIRLELARRIQHSAITYPSNTYNDQPTRYNTPYSSQNESCCCTIL